MYQLELFHFLGTRGAEGKQKKCAVKKGEVEGEDFIGPRSSAVWDEAQDTGREKEEPE